MPYVAFIPLTALCRADGNMCAYFCVIDISECPNISDTYSIRSPCARALVAKVWRKSCQTKSVMLLLRRQVCHAVRLSNTLSPVLLLKKMKPRRQRGCVDNVSKIFTASSVRGTIRCLPFLEISLGIIISLPSGVTL